MPLAEINTKDTYTQKYFELIGKPVRVHTNDGGFTYGTLENVNTEGITLRPSLINESLVHDEIIYRIERDLPSIIEIPSLNRIIPVSIKHLNDLLETYSPKDENQLELF